MCTLCQKPYNFHSSQRPAGTCVNIHTSGKTCIHEPSRNLDRTFPHTVHIKWVSYNVQDLTHVHCSQCVTNCPIDCLTLFTQGSHHYKGLSLFTQGSHHYKGLTLFTQGPHTHTHTVHTRDQLECTSYTLFGSPNHNLKLVTRIHYYIP